MKLIIGLATAVLLRSNNIALVQLPSNDLIQVNEQIIIGNKERYIGNFIQDFYNLLNHQMAGNKTDEADLIKAEAENKDLATWR